MSDIKLSINTAIAVVHELNQKSSDSRCRALIKDLTNLMMDATDNKAEAPKRNGYQEIAEAMGMPPMRLLDLESIKTYAAELYQSNTRQAGKLRDRHNESTQDKASLQYHRDCLKQLRDTIGTDPGITPARLVEMIIERLKHDAAMVGKLDQMMTASHFADSDGVPTILSVLQYRKRVTDAADLIAGDHDTLEYLAKLEAENASMKVKLQRIDKEVNGIPTVSCSDTIHRIRGVLADD